MPKDKIKVSDLSKHYKGKWATLTNDEKSVLGVGDTVDSVIKQAHRKGVERPLLIKVPIAEKRLYFY